MTKRSITAKDVDLSYEIGALLHVCRGAAAHLEQQVGPGPLAPLSGSLGNVLEILDAKWIKVHDALEGAQRADPEPEK